MKRNVAVLLQQVDVESLALLLGRAENEQGFARRHAISRNAALVRHRLKAEQEIS